MNQELEKTLLSINDTREGFNKHKWYLIVDSLLDDFQNFIGFSIERSYKKNIFLDIKYPNNPGFSTNLWTSHQQEKDNYYSPVWTKLIKDKVCKDKDENYCSSIKWIGIMSGTIRGVIHQQENKDIFCISVTFLLFDPISKKRLHLNKEKGLLIFSFVPMIDYSGEWQILGWAEDEFEEWDHINSWNDLLI